MVPMYSASVVLYLQWSDRENCIKLLQQVKMEWPVWINVSVGGNSVPHCWW